MRDIPVFATQYGAASLVLREIPYKGIAYITVQDTQNPEELLRECVEFCRAAGAERIYATGHEFLKKYPVYTAVLQMSRRRDGLPETDAALFPVTEKTLEQWRGIYNEKMEGVANAATMTKRDGEALLARGAGYFVHRGDELLGIGVASGETVETVIALKPGAGRDVLLSLCSCIFADRIMLEVASVNVPAVRLYEKFGFIKTAELSKWYILQEKMIGDKKIYLTSKGLWCMICEV